MSKTFKLGELATRDEAKAKLTSPRSTATPEPAKKTAPPVEDDPLKPFNVRLPASQVTALGRARLEDGITAVARIRALVAIWEADEDVRLRVADLAQRTAEMEKARKRAV